MRLIEQIDTGIEASEVNDNSELFTWNNRVTLANLF